MTQAWLLDLRVLLPLLLCCSAPGGVPPAAPAGRSEPAPAPAGASAAAPQPELAADGADVAITARIRARELRFEVVPSPQVRLLGPAGRSSVWRAQRIGLPTPVEPGVVYRDVGVDLEILSGIEVRELGPEAPPQAAPEGQGAAVLPAAVPASAGESARP